MCFQYDEANDVYEERYVTTRKQHRCEACDKMIVVRSPAKCCSGHFDGCWFRYYVCNRCERLTLAIVVNELHEGCRWGQAWCAPQDLMEYVSDKSYDWETETERKDVIRPLGMRTLQDCRRVVDDIWNRISGYARPDGTDRFHHIPDQRSLTVLD